MVPIGDDNTSRRTQPVVTYALIALNILFFLVELGGGDAFIQTWAFVPNRFLANPGGDFLTIYTSMFMHGGWLHIGGNMLYLWIFGDNVEDAWGHVGYLLFYLAGGVTATLAHVFTNPTSVIPTVGASGAIAAVLGAYLVLYPQSRVLTFIPIGYFMTLKLIPAAIVLGVWFILQFFNGVLSLGGPDVGGTAFWAHIGGFLAGVLLALLFGKRRNNRQQRRWS